MSPDFAYHDLKMVKFSGSSSYALSIHQTFAAVDWASGAMFRVDIEGLRLMWVFEPR